MDAIVKIFEIDKWEVARAHVRFDFVYRFNGYDLDGYYLGGFKSQVQKVQRDAA